DGVAQLALDVADPVGVAAAGDLLVEDPGRGDLERVDAERPEADGTELAVADRDRVGRPPLLVQAQPRREEVDVALERRLEHLVPVGEVGQDRDVLRLDRVLAGPEQIGRLALVHEQRRLGLAHGELGALLDLHVAHGEAPGEDLVALLGPLDDVDELLLDEVKKTHPAPPRANESRPSITVGRRAEPSQGTEARRLTTRRALRYDSP